MFGALLLILIGCLLPYCAYCDWRRAKWDTRAIMLLALPVTTFMGVIGLRVLWVRAAAFF